MKPTNNPTAIASPQYHGWWIAWYDDADSSCLYGWGKAEAEALEDLKRTTEEGWIPWK